MSDLEDLTPEEKDELIRKLMGNAELCGREAIYLVPSEGTFVCGHHSGWFFDDELQGYDGPETCMAVI